MFVLESRFYCYSFVVQLEIGGDDTSTTSFITEDCFNCLGILVLPYAAENCPFCQELCWNIGGNFSELSFMLLVNGHFYYVDSTNLWA